MGGPIASIAKPNVVPVKTEGGMLEARVSDDNTQQLLNDTVKELKKMNLQMSIMTDNQVTNADVE